MRSKPVICAIDVNDFDQEVINLAATFALHFDVDLEIVHVTAAPDTINAARPAYLGSSSVLINENRRLVQVKPDVGRVAFHHHHLSGDPSAEILGFIERNGPQLVVLGTHGRKGLSRIFGSVATQVLRKARCPVMVLRQQQNSQDFSNINTPNMT